MKVVAGMDVGKTHMAGLVRRFENTPAGLAALVGWLEREGVTDVVCEATGGYERPLGADEAPCGGCYTSRPWPWSATTPTCGGSINACASKTGKVAVVAVMRKLLRVLQRHCTARNPVGRTPSPTRRQKGLTSNTDTPATAGIQS